MDSAKLIIKRMCEVAKIANNKDLSDFLEVSYNTLNTWIKRDSIPMDKISEFVQKRQLSYDWFLTGKGEMLLNKQKETLSKPREQKEQAIPNLVNIPYFEDTYAAAGVGGHSYDDKPTVMAFDSTFLKSTLGISEFKNLHIITAVGDSMTPTITSGELLFINPFENENNTIKDKGVYVISTPNGLLVKRIKIYPIKKMWTLISDNPKDDDIELMEDEIDSCRVVGRVVGHFDRI